MIKIVILFSVITLFGCEKKVPVSSNPQQRLVEGNLRFVSGNPSHPDETLERLRDLKKGQNPFAVLVSCSDSRVPPELLFDQGFGDIFSIRTAGNVIGDYELGSIEYAIENLGCELVVVMGHTDCGAIKAYVESDGHYNHFDHIKKIVEYIEEESEEKELVSHHQLTLSKAVEANIHHGVHLLKDSEPIIKTFVAKKHVKIIGALYDLETGKVSFYE